MPSTWSNWALTIFAAIGAVFALVTLERLREEISETKKAAEAATRSADADTLAMQLSNRGFAHIGDWGNISISDEQSNVMYSISNRGKTPIHVEGGFMRLQFQMEPITNPEHPAFAEGEFALNPTKFLIDPALEWTQPIPSQRIGPFAKAPDMLRPLMSFPPMTPLGVRLWKLGINVKVFLTGEIVYRDSFFPGTKRHRKYFAIKTGRNQGGWYKNEAGRNDEDDDES